MDIADVVDGAAHGIQQRRAAAGEVLLLRQGRHLAQRQKEKYDWEFLFLGANIDAAKEAARFGIGADRAVNYKCDEAGTALNYEVISEAVCSVRAARPLSADWKRRIDEDVQKRGR